MKSKFKVKVKEAVLFALEKAVDGYVVLEEFYDNPHKFVWYGPPDLPNSKLSLAISRLRKQGFIEKSKDEVKIYFKLTEIGRDWLVKHSPEEHWEWDGLWRIVIFDIPETHARVRNILRRRLKEWGFKKWQKSVWASRKPLTKPLRDLVKQLEIDDWVLVIESNSVGENIKFFNDRLTI